MSKVGKCIICVLKPEINNSDEAGGIESVRTQFIVTRQVDYLIVNIL
jgi:hypothetical protein